MKLYTDVIARSQRRASRSDRGIEKAYLRTLMLNAKRRKLPYLSDMTWSDRLASYVHGVGGREENNGVALKEMYSNEEAPAGGIRPLYTCPANGSPLRHGHGMSMNSYIRP